MQKALFNPVVKLPLPVEKVQHTRLSISVLIVRAAPRNKLVPKSGALEKLNSELMSLSKFGHRLGVEEGKQRFDELRSPPEDLLCIRNHFEALVFPKFWPAPSSFLFAPQDAHCSPLLCNQNRQNSPPQLWTETGQSLLSSRLARQGVRCPPTKTTL